MEHLRHYASFETSNTRNPYEIREGGEGWFLFADVVDLNKRKELLSTYRTAVRERELTYIDPRIGISVTRHRSAWWPIWDDFAFIDRRLRGAYYNGAWREHTLRGILLKPFIVAVNTEMAQDEFDFTPAITVGDQVNWEFKDSGDGLFTEMLQGQGIDTTLAVSYDNMVQSIVDWKPSGGLCPNLFFAFGFRRQALDLDTIELIDTLAETAHLVPDIGLGTTCYFGGTLRSADGEGGYEGGFEWRLAIPLNGEPYLQRAVYNGSADATGTWANCEWSAGSLSKFDYYEMAVQGKTYYIGVIGNCICISEDHFEDDFAVYECVDTAQPIIASGAVRIHNWPGQCAFWLAPLGFVQDQNNALSYIERTAVAVGNYQGDLIGPTRHYLIGFSPKGIYDPDALAWPVAPDWWPNQGDWWQWGWQQQVAGEPPTLIVRPPLWPPGGPPGEWPALPPPGWPQGMDWPPTDACPEPVNPTLTQMSGGGVTMYYWPFDEPETGNPQWLKWRVYFEPAMWTPGGGAMPTFTTPFLESVCIWQAAEYESPVNTQTYGEPAAVKAVTVAEAELGNDTSVSVEVSIDNAAANYGGVAPSTLLREGAICRVTVGTEFADTSVSQLTYGGLVLTGIEAGPEVATLTLSDPLGMMNVVKWDRGDINFRYWNPTAAMKCVLPLCGIPENIIDFEDLGMVLVGDWTWSLGTAVRQIVSDLSSYAKHASVWWDPVAGTLKSGCPYCRTKRTSATWAAHQDNGWNSSGCLAADAARIEGGTDWTLVYDTAAGGNLSMIFAEDFQAAGSRLTGDYVNRMVAEGIAVDGQVLRMLVQDDKAFGTDGTFVPSHYVGWRKNEVIHVDGEATWDTLAQAIVDNKAAFGERGIDVSGVPIPMNPLIRVGQVMTVVGGYHAGANGRKFRIRSCQHDPTRGRTVVSLKQMVGVSG